MRRTFRFIELCILAAILSGGTAGAADLPRSPEKLPPDNAVDAWLAVVEDPGQTSARRNFAEARIIAMGRAAAPRLLALWKDASDDRCGTLADIFGGMADLPPEGVDALLAEVKEKGPRASPSVVRALACRNVATAGPALAEILPRTSGDLRLATLNALGRLGDDNASADMLRALDDPDRLVRTMAADALVHVLCSLHATAEAKRKDAYRPLLRRALDYVSDGKSADSRRILASGLGAVGDADASRTLRQVLRIERGDLRVAAATSLGTLRCRDAVRDLVDAADAKDPVLRRAALDALTAVGEIACVPDLVEIMAHCAPAERRDVVRALRQIARQPFGDNPDDWRQWWRSRQAAPKT